MRPPVGSLPHCTHSQGETRARSAVEPFLPTVAIGGEEKAADCTLSTISSPQAGFAAREQTTPFLHTAWTSPAAAAARETRVRDPALLLLRRFFTFIHSSHQGRPQRAAPSCFSARE